MDDPPHAPMSMRQASHIVSLVNDCDVTSPEAAVELVWQSPDCSARTRVDELAAEYAELLELRDRVTARLEEIEQRQARPDATQAPRWPLVSREFAGELIEWLRTQPIRLDHVIARELRDGPPDGTPPPPQIPCTYCTAQPGQYCHTDKGSIRWDTPHTERRRAAGLAEPNKYEPGPSPWDLDAVEAYVLEQLTAGPPADAITPPDIACDSCGAAPAEYCVSHNGRVMWLGLHSHRRRLAGVTPPDAIDPPDVACPTCDAKADGTAPSLVVTGG